MYLVFLLPGPISLIFFQLYLDITEILHKFKAYEEMISHMYILQRDFGSPTWSLESRKRKQTHPESQHGGESYRLRKKEHGGSRGCLALGPGGSCGNSIFPFFRRTDSPPLPVHVAWVGQTDGPRDWPFASSIPLSSDWLKGDGHVSQWRPMRGLGLPDVEDISPTGHKPWKVSISLAVQVHRLPLSGTVLEDCDSHSDTCMSRLWCSV